MPVAVRAFPEEAPAAEAGHVPDLGDGFLGELVGPIEHRAHDEKLDAPVGETLPLANLVAQMHRRTSA